MKRMTLFLALLAALPVSLQAQDDDMYFVPTKEKVRQARASYGIPESTYYSGSSRSVDEYNRRAHGSSYEPIAGDSTMADVIEFSAVEGVYPSDSTSDYRYTREMARWDGYTPTDAYWEGYDQGRSDEWRASSWHSPFYYSSFYPWYDSYWYDPWYYSSWHYGWYDPWYYRPYYWGGYYSSWHYRPYYYGGGYASYRHSRGHNPYAGHHGSVSGSRSSAARAAAGTSRLPGRAGSSGTGRASVGTRRSSGSSYGSSSSRSSSIYSGGSSSSSRSSSTYSGSHSSSSSSRSSSGSFGGGRSGGIGGGSRAGGRR